MRRYFRSIVTKLFALIVACVVMVVAGISLQVNRQVHTLLSNHIASGMVQQARESANGVVAIVDAWAGLTAQVTHQAFQVDRSLGDAAAEALLESNLEFIAFGLSDDPGAADPLRLFKVTSRNQGDPRYGDQNPEAIRTNLRALCSQVVQRLRATVRPPTEGKMAPVVVDLAKDTGLPIMATATPFTVAGGEDKVWAVLISWNSRLVAVLPQGEGLASHLLDHSGAPLLSVTTSAEPLDPSTASSLAAEAERERNATGFRRIEEDEGRAGLWAFSQAGRLRLAVVVGRDAEITGKAIAAIIARTANWVVLFLLISVLMCYVVSSGITRNLRSVTLATRKIAEGQFDQRLSLKTNDEVGVLGGSVNMMAGRIEQLIADRVESSRIEAELATAQLVQNTFIARGKAESGKLEIVGEVHNASECSGDWWAHYDLGGDRELVCIADVTGHGVSSALVTAMVYSFITTRVEDFRAGRANLTLGDVVQGLNDLLYVTGRGRLTTTFLALLVDVKTGEVEACGNGHTFPLLVPASKDDDRLNRSYRYVTLRARGDVLGMMPKVNIRPLRFGLRERDRVLLYTDGLTEGRSPTGVAWGLRGINICVQAELARTATVADFKNAVLASFNRYCGLSTPADDVSIVVLEWRSDMKMSKVA